MPLISVSNRPQALVAAIPPATPGLPLPALPMPVSGPPTPPPTPRVVPIWLTALGAAAVFALFAFVFVRMFDLMDDAIGAEVWSRALLLYDSVQVLAVAAVSTVLGVQVSRGEAIVARTESTRLQSEKATLTGKVRSFQEEIRRSARRSEAGTPLDGDRIVAHAMTLLD